MFTYRHLLALPASGMSHNKHQDTVQTLHSLRKEWCQYHSLEPEVVCPIMLIQGLHTRLACFP